MALFSRIPQLHELLEGRAGWLLVNWYCLILHGTASLFELLEFIICVMSFPASALILFSCEQSVYSIDTNCFYAKLICSARENTYWWLCWIWEPVKLIIPAFSYQIVDCTIRGRCISVKGKKENSVLFSFCFGAPGDAEKRNVIPEDLRR